MAEISVTRLLDTWLPDTGLARTEPNSWHSASSWVAMLLIELRRFVIARMPASSANRTRVVNAGAQPTDDVEEQGSCEP
ncbi:hypothetical protein [Cupriavidus basilensis]